MGYFSEKYGYAEETDAQEVGEPGVSNIVRPEGPDTGPAEEFGFAQEGDEKPGYFAEKYGFAEEETAPEETPMEEDPTWQDYGRMVMSGGASIGSGLGWLLEKMGPEGSALEAGGKALKKRGQESADTWMQERLDVIGLEEEGLSEQAKIAMQQELLGESLTDGAKFNKIKLMTAGSLLGTMAGMGMGSVFTKGLQVAGLGAKTAGTIGFSAGEAGVAAPAAGAFTEQDINNMSHEELSESLEYQAILEGMSGEADEGKRQAAAKELLAKAAGNKAAAITAVTTFVLSAPFGAQLQRLTSGATAARLGRPGAVVTGAATEATQEFAQSGAEKISENIAVRGAGLERGIFEGALEEAVGGAGAGGIMGGVVGGATGPEAAPSADPTTDKPKFDPDSAMAEIEAIQEQAEQAVLDQGGDALDAATAGAEAVEAPGAEIQEQREAGELAAELAAEAAVVEAAAEPAPVGEVDTTTGEIIPQSNAQERRGAAVTAAQEKQDTREAELRDIAKPSEAEKEAVRQRGMPRKGKAATAKAKKGPTSVAAGAKAGTPRKGKAPTIEVISPTKEVIRGAAQTGAAPAVVGEFKQERAGVYTASAGEETVSINKTGSKWTLRTGTGEATTHKTLKEAKAAAVAQSSTPAAKMEVAAETNPEFKRLSQIEETAAKATSAANEKFQDAAAQIEAEGGKIDADHPTAIALDEARAAQKQAKAGVDAFVSGRVAQQATEPKLSAGVGEVLFRRGDFQVEVEEGPVPKHLPDRRGRKGIFNTPTSQLIQIKARKGGKDVGGMNLRRRGDQLQVIGTMLDESVRGEGGGQQLIMAAVKYAADQGMTITSDTQVSALQLRAYEALAKKGELIIEYSDAQAVKRVLAAAGEGASGANVNTGYQPVITSMTTPAFNEEIILSKTMTQPGARVTTAELGEIERAITLIASQMPGIQAEILQDYTELPQAFLDTKDPGLPHAKGLFNPQSGRVFIFLNKATSVTDAVHTLLHEGVAHKGLRLLMKDQFPALMDDIWENAPMGINLKIQAKATSYGLDTKIPAQRHRAVDEYIATMAETMPADTPILQKVIDAVRQFLRNVGMLNEWTDSDILALLRDSRRAVKGKPASMIEITSQVRVAETEEVVTLTEPANIVMDEIDQRIGVAETLRACL